MVTKPKEFVGKHPYIVETEAIRFKMWSLIELLKRLGLFAQPPGKEVQ